jgi:signal transduction histidine kinase/DNA-binding response OmpR family regulator
MGKPKVLVVDDHAENRLTVRSVIEVLHVEVFEAGSGKEALRLLLKNDFAVILLDVEMPITGGFEIAQMIRSRTRTRHTPIIFLTGGGRGEAGAARGYALGAVDYIIKPFVPEILRWKVSVFAGLYTAAEQAEELRREQAVRQDWETAAKRSALLADVTSLLASNMNYAATIARIPELLVPEFADWATVVNGVQSAYVLSQISQSASPVLLEEVDSAFLQELGANEKGPSSAILVPLSGRDRMVGVLVMFRSLPHGYAATDRLLAKDLAARAALAIANAQLYEELQAASRAKDQFLAVVSHELRTPLNAIAGWTQILRTKELSGEARDKALQTIEKSAKIQNELISDILDISRIVSGQLSVTFEDVQFDAVVHNTVEAVKPVAEAKGLQLTATVEAGLPLIAGDPKRLQQVLWNLVANAIKFTPKNGSIRLNVDTTPSHLRVQVHDTGAGIRREMLPRLFDAFFQGDTSFKRPNAGLGLGLAITRHLVELHGGTVKAESAGEGHGSVFTIMLPIRHARERAS